jgi:hypothetical protein
VAGQVKLISRRYLAAALFIPVFAIAQQPTFSGGVDLIHVDAQVLNRDGDVVHGLRQDDFRLFEAGQEQSIVAFAVEDQPLDLVLVVDISASMTHAVESFALAAQSALDQLHAGDRVAVMTFNTRTKILATFTDNISDVKATVLRIPKARGRTHAIDAVYDAAALLRKVGSADEKRERRRAVLIFTDNATRGDKHSTASAAQALWEADAALCGMITRPALPHPFVVGPYVIPEYLTTGGVWPIVDATGGEISRARDVDLPDMLHRIRSRYSIYYKLPDGKTATPVRDITLELTAAAQRRVPGARVIYRARDKV